MVERRVFLRCAAGIGVMVIFAALPAQGGLGMSVAAALKQMEINFARAEFSSGMAQLASTAGKLCAFRSVIEELERAWIGYRELFVAGPKGGFRRRTAAQITERSEQTLVIIERLVALFERQAQPRSS